MGSLMFSYWINLFGKESGGSPRIDEICLGEWWQSTDQAKALQQAWKEGKYSSKADLAKAFGISRPAVSRYLKFID